VSILYPISLSYHKAWQETPVRKINKVNQTLKHDLIFGDSFSST